MKKKSYLLACAAALLVTGGTVIPTDAAFDENLNTYTLDAVVVNADRTKNQFGDTITEQSYYRTGGDVKVITREEIEKRHYNDLTDAIKRIPGVNFINPGYRGGEYGYAAYNNSLSINGDSRVVILVDGRRVDNSASEQFGSSDASGTRTMVDLNQITSMENVDKIEVIKGPGASAYGADATGGVINIITRKGTVKDTGTIDLSTGSWHKHVYNISYSGSVGSDHSWKYFVSGSRQMSGDTKYHDGVTDKDYTYKNTSYKEDNISFRIDKDFDSMHSLKISFNHKGGKDHYPITAPDHRYWSEQGWKDTLNRSRNGVAAIDNPGYRNLFYLDAINGSYNSYNNNDLDISYTFRKDNGMESFVRFYNEQHHFWGKDLYPKWYDRAAYTDSDGVYHPATHYFDGFDEGLIPFPGSSGFSDIYKKNFWKWNSRARAEANQSDYTEKSRGLVFQYGKSIGKNDLLGSINYDVSWLDGQSYGDETHTKKTTIRGFAQDKIHINDKWDLTPAVRYLRYNTASGSYSDYNGAKYGGSKTSVTPSLNTEYMITDSLSLYAGWSQVFRPVKSYDLTKITPNGAHLRDEKGNVYTLGLRKDYGPDTTLAVHYDWTDMSNAITYYSTWNASKETLIK